MRHRLLVMLCVFGVVTTHTRAASASMLGWLNRLSGPGPWDLDTHDKKGRANLVRADRLWCLDKSGKVGSQLSAIWDHSGTVNPCDESRDELPLKLSFDLTRLRIDEHKRDEWGDGRAVRMNFILNYSSDYILFRPFEFGIGLGAVKFSDIKASDVNGWEPTVPIRVTLTSRRLLRCWHRKHWRNVLAGISYEFGWDAFYTRMRADAIEGRPAWFTAGEYVRSRRLVLDVPAMFGY